ncbi:hypothetical protein [Enterococcus villorum]|nr:hypothetical protein [Enterococcus villorum]
MPQTKKNTCFTGGLVNKIWKNTINWFGYFSDAIENLRMNKKIREILEVA